MKPPFPAYDGTGPYVFICWSHRDQDSVYAEMQRLQADGVNVWYDEGIRPDTEWTADIAQAINDCAQFLFFVSNNSVQSKHCRRELHYAMSRNNHVTVVYLEPTELPDQLELQIGLTQAIHKYNLTEDDYRRKTGVALRRLQRGLPGSRWLWATSVVVALVLVAAIGWLGRDAWRATPADDGVIRVAVLPFKNTSGDPAQNYVGDALSEEIWNRLSGEPTLRLIAMTSARTAINQGLDVRQMADILDVNYLVEGSINRAGDLARVSVRLIDAQHGGDLLINQLCEPYCVMG